MDEELKKLLLLSTESVKKLTDSLTKKESVGEGNIKSAVNKQRLENTNLLKSIRKTLQDTLKHQIKSDKEREFESKQAKKGTSTDDPNITPLPPDIKVGDEIMEINSLTGTTAYTETQTEYYIQMVVKRAQLGTSQATHTAGETVEVYDGPPTPQEITTTTETVVQAAGPLGNGDELVDRKLFNTTIPTSKYMYYVIDWDDKEDKIKTWDDVLSNFPSNTNQLLNLQNQGLYLVKEMGHPNSKSY